MPKLKHRVPSYRRHKGSNQAVVSLSGRDIYLGKHNSPDSRREYNRLIAEWAANNGTLAAPHDLTVVELCAAFLRHAKTYYKRPDGTRTGEVASYKTLIGRLKAFYGHTLVGDFGPLALKTFRQQLIELGLARK
ncbi:MAG TPA: site-specific integrase, partial [Pirellulales bacterium]|nr:site-specific integrase [Pirellulales bacterium]